MHTFRRVGSGSLGEVPGRRQAKNLKSPADLAAQLKRCTPGFSPYRPNPKPDIPGATAWNSVITHDMKSKQPEDTTDLQCQ